MIDLDDMESLLQHCKELDEAGGLANRVTPSVVIELITRLRQAEKDAARYRWLRDDARHHMDGCPLTFMTDYDGEPIAYPECGMVLHESYLDEAIDEAMQCK